MKQRYRKIVSTAMTAVMCTGVLSQFAPKTVLADNERLFGTKEEQLQTVENGYIPGTESLKTEGTFDGSYLSVTGYASVDDETHHYLVSDRSEYKEGDPEYAVANNEEEFLTALSNASKGTVKVIEVRADLDLGYDALSTAAKNTDVVERYGSTDTINGCSYANPDLMQSGISEIKIDTKGLTIFSTQGYSISHAEFKIQATCNDIVIRNLRFDGMWDWDDWQGEELIFLNDGGHKRVGWTTFKINGADNIWLDHCEFGIAFDGCVDISGTTKDDGCEGISITWCTFGEESQEPGSMVYNTMEYLESIYQESKENPNVDSFTMYGILRDNGLTPEEVMTYGNFHSKAQLTGDGEGDWDKNPRTRYTLAYNQYYNMQQRVPMVRQGSVHLFNCLIDYSARSDVLNKISTQKNDAGETISYQLQHAGQTVDANGTVSYFGSVWSLDRAIDARDGASIAADTCVYDGVSRPITGSEMQLADVTAVDPADSTKFTDNLREWVTLADGGGKVRHDFGYNHALIVNSSVTKYTYDSNGKKTATTTTGSSWDSNGNNEFVEGGASYWNGGGESIGNWTWKELSPETTTINNSNIARLAQLLEQDESTYSSKTESVLITAIAQWKADGTYEQNIAALKEKCADTTTPRDNEAEAYNAKIASKDSNLPYSYKTVSLEDVRDCVTTYGGAGTLDMTAEEWLQTEYDSSYTPKFMEKTQNVDTITLDETDAILASIERLQLHATIAPYSSKEYAIANLDWTSSNEDVATVGDGGLVVPKGLGTTVITATTPDGKSAQCKVEVVELPTSVVIEGVQGSTLYVGDVYQLSADMKPDTVTHEDATWSTSNAARVSITEDGKIEALAKGSCTVRATANLTANRIWNQSLVRGEATFTVRDCTNPTTGVKLDASEVTLACEEGQSLQLNSEIIPSDSTNKKMTWTSSDESVATVDSTGTITPVSIGTAVITVTTINGAKTAECTVNVVGAGQDTVIKTQDTITNEDGTTTDRTVETTTKADGTVEEKQIDVITIVDGAAAETIITDTKKDDNGDVQQQFVYKDTAVPSTTEWIVEDVATPDAAVIEAIEAAGAIDSQIWDIKAIVDGEQVQVTSGEGVQVTLKLADDIEVTAGMTAKVLDIEKQTWLDAALKDGYVVFTAKHFSQYAVVLQEGNSSQEPVDPADPSGEPVDPADPSGEPVDPADPSGGPVDPADPSGGSVTGALLGDATEDGNINTSDALRILRYTLGKAELTEQGLKNADVNGDGNVNTSDALRILRYTLGKATLGSNNTKSADSSMSQFAQAALKMALRIMNR